jgi:hypothetical protein
VAVTERQPQFEQRDDDHRCQERQRQQRLRQLARSEGPED